jgi:hypothetical protein
MVLLQVWGDDLDVRGLEDDERRSGEHSKPVRTVVVAKRRLAREWRQALP